VDLSKSEESQDSLDSWAEAVNTSNSNSQEELSLSRNEEGAASSCLSSLLDELEESLSVSFNIALSSLGDLFSLLLAFMLSGLSCLVVEFFMSMISFFAF